MSNKIEIHGYCDERFESVKKVFANNIETGLDIGASFAVTLNGEFVIDIWGGYADAAQTSPWERDTIVNVYSTTKMMTAICTLMLVDRGLLDLDSPVAKYWPEFAQAGKENLPVRYLLSHSAGLPGFDKPIHPKALYDWDLIVNGLAAQKPWWEPGTKIGYHALTFGYLLGELVKRVTNKTIGTFFREEVANPLNADFHIGLPEEHDHHVGELIPPPPLDPTEFREVDPGSIAMKVLLNPALTSRETLTREWRGAEIPAANGHGNSRSVARITAALACDGELDGVKLLSLKTIEKAIEEQFYETDLVLQMPIRYGLGFGLNSKEMPISPNPRTFYWGGWGGSVVAIDLDAKVSFSFVMNKMVMTLTGDPRTIKLGEALNNVITTL